MNNQKMKTKFRATSRWRDFRKFIKDTRQVDEVTLKPLRAGFQVHHLDLRPEHYTNIEDEERFLACNRLTHSMLHDLYRYYIKDPKIITRLENALKMMRHYSND